MERAAHRQRSGAGRDKPRWLFRDWLRRRKPISTVKVFHIPLDMSALAVALGNENFARRVTGHLHYYSKDSALATLEACGYEVLSWRFTDTFTLPFRNLGKGGQLARQ